MIVEGNKLEITVESGKFIIDAEDISKILSYNWRVTQIGNTKYVKSFQYRSGKPIFTYYIHRMILGIGKEEERVVDHIDGNGLNNSKSNLRIVTRSENCARSINRKDKSFRGVIKRGSIYYSYIQYKGKKLHVGKFSDEVCAAMAYDKASIELNGVMAVLNLPDLISEHKNLILRDFKNF